MMSDKMIEKYSIKKNYYGDNYIEYVRYKQPVYVGYYKPPKPTTYLDGTPMEEEQQGLHQFQTIEQALEYIEELRKEKLKRSLRRTKKKIADIILSNLTDKSYFHTYTFGKDVIDIKQANEYWNKFMKRLKYNYQTEFVYIAIPERQPISKRIHYHCIIFNGFNMNKQTLSDIWGGGFVKIKKIRDISQPLKLVNYFMNYLTKEEQNIDITGKKYFTSRNIKNKKSVYVRDYDNINEFFKDLDTANDESIKERDTRSTHKTLIKLSN